MVAVAGLDDGDIVGFAVVHLHLKAAGLADDVQIRGDEAVVANDEAGADAVGPLAAKLGDFDQRGTDGGGEIGGGAGGRSGGPGGCSL